LKNTNDCARQNPQKKIKPSCLTLLLRVSLSRAAPDELTGVDLMHYVEVNKKISYYRRLIKVNEFVQKNYSEKIKIDDVAKIANLERKYFSVYFKKNTGICFRDWLSWVRIQKAISLMEEHNYQITEISYSVGFSDLRTFERAFKKMTGYTPSSFKSRLKP
jgi:YesN/AraC family two-component response regulator